MTPDGLTIYSSGFGPRETMDRLVAAVTGRGMSILARIDHAAAAATAGLALRPTEVLIFGNARAGTPLMQTAPTLGIDLPLKALVLQDEAGTTWLAFNDPMWLSGRHGGKSEHEPILRAMAEALAEAADAATIAGD